MRNDININTGNPIVDQVGRLSLTGNVIPEAWFDTIVNDKGKVDSLAILILAEIVYWYRPAEERNEHTNEVTYKRKFKDNDYLQKSYEQIADKFNISKNQAKNHVVILENLGVIKRHFRDISTQLGKLINVLYIELIPSVLEELTFPDSDGGMNKKIETSTSNDIKVCKKTMADGDKKRNTNTETTSKNKTKNTTTANPVVVEASDLFEEYNLSESEIKAIVEASEFDLTKCQTAKELLVRQTSSINNLVGWLINAVKNDYSISTPIFAKNAFKCTSRNYSKKFYEELEADALMDN